MKLLFWPGLVSVFIFTVSVFPQNYRPEPTPTPIKVVVTNNLPSPTRIVQVTPSPTPMVIGRPRIVGDEDDRTPDAEPTPQPFKPMVPTEFRTMSFAQIKSKIAEAKREMQSRPMQTASADPAITTSLVRIAFYD